MNFFRNNMKILLYFIIFGFIISLFAGIGTYIMSQKQNTVAIVNKEKIKLDDFNRIFSNLVANNKNPESAKQEALQILMQDTLLLQETSKIGDFISKNEVRNQISQYPIFQQNGQFSREMYHKNLKYLIKQTPEDFEKYIRKRLIMEKGKYFIASAIKTTPKEIQIETETTQNADYARTKQYLLINEWFKNKAALAETKVFYENQ